MPDLDDLQFNKPEDEIDYSDMSIDELLESTREELAHDDELMGETPEQKAPEEQPRAKSTFPPFKPTLPEEYADLTVDDAPQDGPEEPDEEAPPARPRLAPGLRVLLYVCCVLAASVLLAVGAWLCADDVLALTKPNRKMTVTIAENASIDDVTRALHDNGLVNYPWLFKFYCWYSHAEQKIEPGTYTLNNIYDYHALVNAMRETSQQRSTVEVTIPEGYECKDIFALLAEQGVCSTDKLEAAAADYEFDYAFLQGLPYGDKNRLEGYLFPDTYEFYVKENADSALSRLLANFQDRIVDDPDLAPLIANSSYSLKEIVIMASLIEKETDGTDRTLISSVIHNRLENVGETAHLLQIDASLVYAAGREITEDDYQTLDSPYNLYTHQGLPPTAIANAGKASIQAALQPDDTNYYFYVLNPDTQRHVFSRTLSEHNANLRKFG